MVGSSKPVNTFNRKRQNYENERKLIMVNNLHNRYVYIITKKRGKEKKESDSDV